MVVILHHSKVSAQCSTPGSTIGRFLDTVAAGAVEMIDGLEGLGTLTLDQIENSFDDDPNNDFLRR